jgi:hypothetical protein
MEITILLRGITDQTGRPISLKKSFPLDHCQPNLDYLATLSKGDVVLLSTHDSSTEFNPFSSIRGEVTNINKWVCPERRKTTLRGIIIQVSEFHVSTYKASNVLSDETGGGEILADWEQIPA